MKTTYRIERSDRGGWTLVADDGRTPNHRIASRRHARHVVAVSRRSGDDVSAALRRWDYYATAAGVAE